MVLLSRPLCQSVIWSHNSPNDWLGTLELSVIWYPWMTSERIIYHDIER